jgi:methionyl aminopeptidase
MITVKTPEEIKIMSEGGRILSKIMIEVEKMVKPGITTKELDRAAEALILSKGATPSFKGFNNFPASLCTSVNEEIVHGIPSGRILKDGDIISLDLGLLYKGFHSDMAVTVPVGKVSPGVNRVIKVAKKALKRGISHVRPGGTVGDIGNAIEKYVEGQGFSVVRELCGHGIGKNLHEDPQIPNYGEKNTGAKIKEGMVICIEPMAVIGDWRIKKAKDGYGYETKDGSFAAHFEHTVAITKNGPSVLTEP